MPSTSAVCSLPGTSSRSQSGGLTGPDGRTPQGWRVPLKSSPGSRAHCIPPAPASLVSLPRWAPCRPHCLQAQSQLGRCLLSGRAPVCVRPRSLLASESAAGPGTGLSLHRVRTRQGCGSEDCCPLPYRPAWPRTPVPAKSSLKRAQWVGLHPAELRVTGSTPGQGTGLGCGFDPWWGHARETTNRRFSPSFSRPRPLSANTHSLAQREGCSKGQAEELLPPHPTPACRHR